MPPSGAEARAEQRATLNRIAHELNVSPDLGELLEELRPFEEEHDFESFEASLIRIARRDYEKAVRVPPDLRAEMTRAGSLGYQGWLRAREQEDYAIMLPHLERNLELRRQYVACFETTDDSVRHRPRRLRAGDEDARGRDDLRRAEGGARPLAARGPGCGPDRRLVSPRPFPAAGAASLRARGARALGDGPRRLAAGQDRASVRDVVRADRHPAHDELPRGLAARDPLLPARVRARNLRAPGQSGVTPVRRSRRACRPRSTSRRAACGRTSSGAASRPGVSSIRSCKRTSRSSSATSRSRHSTVR